MEESKVLEMQNYRGAGTKRMLVKFSGGLRPAQEVLIGPGTNSFELLEHMGLSRGDFHLSCGTPDTVFGEDEVLYPHVNDGGVLYVTARVDAGN